MCFKVKRWFVMMRWLVGLLSNCISMLEIFVVYVFYVLDISLNYL